MVSSGEIQGKGHPYTKKDVTGSPVTEDENANVHSLLCEEQLSLSAENSPRSDSNDATISNHNNEHLRPSPATAAASIMKYSLLTEVSEALTQRIFSATDLDTIDTGTPKPETTSHGPRQLHLKRQKPDNSLSRPLFPEMQDEENLFMPTNVSPKFKYLRAVSPEDQALFSEMHQYVKPSQTPSSRGYRIMTVTPADNEPTMSPKQTKKRKAKRSPGSTTTSPSVPIFPEPNGLLSFQPFKTNAPQRVQKKPPSLDEVVESATKMLSAMRTTTTSTTSNSTAASVHSTGSSFTNTTSTVPSVPHPAPSILWPNLQGLQQLQTLQNVQATPQLQEPQRLSVFPHVPHSGLLEQLKPLPQQNQLLQSMKPKAMLQQQKPLRLLLFRSTRHVQPFQEPQRSVQQLSQLPPSQIDQHLQQNVQPMLSQQQQELPSLPLFLNTPPSQQSEFVLTPKLQHFPHQSTSRRLFDDVFSDDEDFQEYGSFSLMNAKDLEPDISVYMFSRDSNTSDIPTEISADTLRRGDTRELPWFPAPSANPVMHSQSSSALYFGDRHGGALLANNNNNLLQQQRLSSPNRTVDDGCQSTHFGRRTRAPLIDDDEPEEDIKIDLDEFFQQFEQKQEESPPPVPLLDRDTSSLLSSPTQHEEVGVRMARTQSIQGDDEDISNLLSHLLLPSPTKHGVQPPQYSSSIERGTRATRGNGVQFCSGSLPRTADARCDKDRIIEYKKLT